MFPSTTVWHRRCFGDSSSLLLPFLLSFLLIAGFSCCAAADSVQPDPPDLLMQASPTAAEPLVVCPAVPSGVQAPSDSTRPAKRCHPCETAVKIARDGLLLIPLDSVLTKAIPKVAVGHPGDLFGNSASSLGTANVLLPTIGGLYAFGGDYGKDTAKKALCALINSSIITGGLKFIAGRGRPSTGVEAGEFESLEPGKGPGFSSFPSGHTSAAFAVATVLANRYPKYKWLCFGLASAVGIARIHLSEHFPSDVLVGAGIGMYAADHALSTSGFDVMSVRIRF